MPEINIAAIDARKDDVVLIGGAHCTITRTEEWNEQLARLCFKDGSMLYLRHTYRLNVEREDPDAELVKAMEEAIREAWNATPMGDQFFPTLTRTALAAYREHTDKDKEDNPCLN